MNLKNLAYINLPKRHKLLNFVIISGLFFLTMIILAFITIKGFSTIEKRHLEDRSPGMMYPISLNLNWKYQNPNESKNWYELKSIRVADQIMKNGGFYKFKKNFRVAVSYRYPTIVLGLISGSHRVFLNGVFIGGSDDSIDLRYYSFDKKILKIKAENELIVEVDSRIGLTPKIKFIDDFGPLLDELSEVQHQVRNYQVEQQIFGSMYFAVLFIFFALSLFVSVKLKDKVLSYYSSLIILLGLLNLAHYNPWAVDYFSYELMHWIKLQSVAVVPILIFSAYLNLNQMHRFELINNIIVLAYSLSSFIIFNFSNSSLEEYILISDKSTLVVLMMVLSMFSFALLQSNNLLYKKKYKNNKSVYYFNLFYIVSGVLSALGVTTLFSPNSNLISFSESQILVIEKLSFAFPMMFCVVYFALKIYEIQFFKKINLNHLKRNQVVLEAFRLFKVSKDPSETLSALLENYCNYLNVNKSRLYVFQGYDPNLSVVFDYKKSTKHFSAYYGNASDPLNRVLAYVIKNKMPLNVKNLAQDHRFNFASNMLDQDGDVVRSCMLIPLISGNEIIGILCFSDKNDKSEFSHFEMNNGVEVSSNLGILLDSAFWHERISKLKFAS